MPRCQTKLTIRKGEVENEGQKENSYNGRVSWYCISNNRSNSNLYMLPHMEGDYLINDVLAGFDYFSVKDATFAVDHMNMDFDEQAVLYAKQNSSGQSKGEITEMMRYYGYTEKQIGNALEKAGF